jgi:hypothetical protein
VRVKPAVELAAENLVYRWDLDKTYLRTDFDTVRDLLRTAFEPPSRKRTVPGASALLRELRATHPAGVYILSGSPQQMRRVLEAKLRLDGIEWDGFTLKPTLQNILQGRIRFMRDQVAYKLEALLSSRIGVPSGSDEILFGDDAEADAFIYSVYADLVAGRVRTDELIGVLERARVYPQHVTGILELAQRIPSRDAVRRIFIHLDRVSALEGFHDYGQRVCPFYNYFQPAMILVEDGVLAGGAALRVGADLVLEHGFSPDALIASFTDLVRRRYVGPVCAERLVDAAGHFEGPQETAATSVLRHFASEVERKQPLLRMPTSPRGAALDYDEVFARDRARAKAAKRRALWRRRCRSPAWTTPLPAWTLG